jgi:hypothetical protein
MIIDPDKKDKVYLENVEKIGNSTKNVHIIKNVLPKKEHKELLNFAKSISEWEKQPWGVYRLVSTQMPNEIVKILSKIFQIAYGNFIMLYDVDVSYQENNLFNIVKFEQGYAMHLHVDTLSVSSLHLASVYYINDDYSGGEINFPDHNLTIKPDANSLLLFPGNENYWHETLEVLENNRYTSTKFFKFSNSTFSGQTAKNHSEKEYYGRTDV